MVHGAVYGVYYPILDKRRSLVPTPAAECGPIVGYPDIGARIIKTANPAPSEPAAGGGRADPGLLRAL